MAASAHRGRDSATPLELGTTKLGWFLTRHIIKTRQRLRRPGCLQVGPPRADVLSVIATRISLALVKYMW